jgi:ATP-dependent DNA helicase RecG
MYETRTILEGLHNCVAHQDYERCERVLVTETPDRLILENAGRFFDGRPEDYYAGKKTPKKYRNPWLAHAMSKIGMIDKMGYGIHNMTTSQRTRYLPLPGYRRSTERDTVLEILGRPIDPNYTQLLLERKDLDLDTVIQLDRVQKGLEISKESASRLRRENLIEGRIPHLRVAAHIASATETEASYLRRKGADKSELKNAVLSYLRRSENVTRPQLDALLIPMLSSSLTDAQKSKKVTNLLSEMQKEDRSIVSAGRGPGASWRVV